MGVLFGTHFFVVLELHQELFTCPLFFFFFFFFLWRVIQDGFHETISLGWLRTMILLICASLVARIISVSHLCPVGAYFASGVHMKVSGWEGQARWHKREEHRRLPVWLEELQILVSFPSPPAPAAFLCPQVAAPHILSRMPSDRGWMQWADSILSRIGTSVHIF
jgi:polyferredoxin